MKISKVLLAVLLAMALLISLPIASYAQTLDFTTGSLPSGVTMTGGAGTSYYDSSNVLHVANAANHPRFDHNPSNGAVLGILIEPANTNVKYVTDPIAHTDTADLDHPGLTNFIASNTGAWAGVWGDMYPADATGPTNVANSAGTFVEDTTLSNDSTIGHHSTNNVQPTTGSAPFVNQSLVVSSYAKRGVGSRNVTQFLIDGNGNAMLFTIDLGTGASHSTVVSGSWTISSASVQAVNISGNPWWRMRVNGSIGATSSLPWRANWSISDSNFTDIYQGDGTSSVEVYGLQVSEGSTTTLANSYIQNSSMSGTASSTADSVSFTIPSGIVSLTYTFDDNSTQTVSVSPGAFTINPSTLNRPWIKTVVMNSSGSAPNPPTGLSATPGNNQVALTWTASSGATSYNVNRSTTSGSGYTTISSPTATNYTDTSVTNGTTYYYVVTATNSHGTSGNSNQASATPSSGSNLVANGTYNVVADNSGLSLSAAGTSNGSLLTQQTYTGAVTEQWTVTNLGSNVDEMVVSGTSEAMEVPGGSTTNGTQLDVSSYTGATYQQWTASSQSGFIQLTNVHSGLAANVTGSSTSPGAAIIQWTLSNTTNEEFTFTAVSGGSSTAFLTGQVLGTARNNLFQTEGFQFTVGSTAITVQGLGRWVISGNTGTHTLTLERASDNSVLGSVSVPTSGAPAGAVKYVNFGTAIPLAANTAYFVQSVETSGGDYCYDDDTTVTTTGVATVNQSIQANINGTPGAHSFGPLSFTYLTSGGSAPAAPTGLSATPGNAQVALTWTASTGATSYNVNRSTTSGSGYSTINSPTTTSYTDTSVTNGTTYYYVVTATNGNGTSGNSNQASATPSSGGSYVVQDGFNDDTRGGPTTSDPLDVAWYSMDVAGTILSVVNDSGGIGNGYALQFAPNSSYQGTIANLASAVTLTSGQTMTLSFSFRYTGTSNLNHAIETKFGIFNSAGTRATADNASETTFSDDVGYFTCTNPGLASSTGTEIGRQIASGTNYIMMGTSWGQLGTATGNSVNSGTTPHTALMTITNNGSTLTISGSIDGLSASTVTDSSPVSTSFDEIGVAFGGGATVSPIIIDNVDVSVTSSSGTTFVTGQTLGALRSNYSGWVGMEVTVGSTPITVKQVGRWVVSGNTAAHNVEVVQASNGAILGSASVTTSGATAGAFKYATLGTSIPLAASTSYYLLSQETSGGDQFCDLGTTVTPSSAGTVPFAAYSTNNTTFVTDGSTDAAYVPVSFTY